MRGPLHKANLKEGSQTRSPVLRTPGFKESHSAAWLAGGVSRAISNNSSSKRLVPEARERSKGRFKIRTYAVETEQPRQICFGAKNEKPQGIRSKGFSGDLTPLARLGVPGEVPAALCHQPILVVFVPAVRSR